MTTDWNVLRTSDLPVRYSEFGGNVNEDGADAEYVTDHHMMWRASEAHEDRNERLASQEEDAYRRYGVSPESCADLWSKDTNETARPDLEPVRLIEVRTSKPSQSRYDTAKMETESGETVWANAQYLRILHLLTSFDELRADEPERSIVAYHDGEPVGLVMPLREPRGPERWEERTVLIRGDG